MTTVKPLTDEQRNTFPGLRVWLADMTKFPLGIAESLEERARQPEPGSLPDDVTVHMEISPPSPHTHPLLDIGALKTPEPVPLYFFTLRGDDGGQAQSASDVPIQDTRVIFFIHGGGNISGHPTRARFMNLFAQLLRSVTSHAHGENSPATKFKCVVVAPSYRLATVPENAFPAALQDLVAAYDHVLRKGYDTSNIVIAGDSVGGNHAVVLTHLILHSGRPTPCGVVAIAPIAMQTTEMSKDPKMRLRANSDIASVAVCETMDRAYIGDSGVAPTNPLVSSSLLTFTAAWPRTLILVGSVDMLINGCRELARGIVAAGASVEFVEYEERPHAWWVFPDIFPEELRDTIGRVARFVLDESASPRPIKSRL